MRFSRYRRRARPSGYGRTLSRLAARLAPTAAQTARGLKQAIRMEARMADDKWATGFKAFQERWPAHVPKPSDMARSYGSGGYFGRVAGSGAYSAESGGMDLDGIMQGDVQPMSFMDGEVDSVRIKKKEYLGAIAGSEAISIRSLILNAGDPATFPSLSRHAMNFEHYKMHGLIFWYKSTSGESTNSASTNIGEVIMCSVSDSQEPLPTSKQQLLETDKPVTAKPSLSSCYGVECADSKPLRIRHGDPNEASSDNTTFDLGRFFIGVEGANILSTRIGELWVSYDCTLSRSRDPRGLETLGFKANWTLAQQANLFASSVPVVGLNSLRLEFNSTGAVIFPSFLNEGTYLMILRGIGVQGSGLGVVNNASPAINPAGTTNCQAIFQVLDKNQCTTNGPIDVDANWCGQYVVRLNAPDSNRAVVQFTLAQALWQNGSAAATSGALQLDVYRIPDAAY